MQNSGVILLNKPVKISSNSAVNKVKYLIGAKKAGHLGTLDPLANGVLPVTFGKATRLFDFFLTKQKTYKAVFVFGFETDTLDSEGKVINLKKSEISELDINQILQNFIGMVEQLPPQFSALKVNGKKAYDIARSGEKVTLQPRKIEIFDIKYKKIDDLTKIEELFNFYVSVNKDVNLNDNIDQIKSDFHKNLFEFEITCGAGTYIRSIVRDMAYKLNTFGTMASLTRIKCGDFDINNCYTFEQIENQSFKVLKTDEVVNLEKIEITSEEGNKLICGQLVKTEPFENLKKLYSNGEFLGLASGKNGKLKIEVFLKED